MESTAVTDFLNYLMVAAVAAALFSVYFFASFCIRLKNKQLIKSMRKLFGLVLFSVVTGFFAMIVIGTQGYQALTHEILAATITVTPNGEQRFVARVVYPDGYSETFQLTGDEVMLEAKVLKWKPWSNIFGLKTAFRLDRIRGRFVDSRQENKLKPVVFDVYSTNQTDIARWRDEFQHLSFLVDVEHGSASYVSASESRDYQLFVTTSGLLIREKP